MSCARDVERMVARRVVVGSFILEVLRWRLFYRIDE